MSLKSFSDLNEMHIDVLKEIGNIGSGNAAAALSNMLGKPIDIAIPEISISCYDDAIIKLGGAETIMTGVMLMLMGDLGGMMMFLLPSEMAYSLVNLLMATDISDYTEIDEMGFSAISEVANIMGASFVRAISDMTGITIEISPPSSTVDMLGAIMSVPAIYFAEMGDKLMYITNELEISGKKTPASIMLLPDAVSLERLMTSLGIDI